jgi:hypothetical protein
MYHNDTMHHNVLKLLINMTLEAYVAILLGIGGANTQKNSEKDGEFSQTICQHKLQKYCTRAH